GAAGFREDGDTADEDRFIGVVVDEGAASVPGFEADRAVGEGAADGDVGLPLAVGPGVRAGARKRGADAGDAERIGGVCGDDQVDVEDDARAVAAGTATGAEAEREDARQNPLHRSLRVRSRGTIRPESKTLPLKIQN